MKIRDSAINGVVPYSRWGDAEKFLKVKFDGGLKTMLIDFTEPVYLIERGHNVGITEQMLRDIGRINGREERKIWRFEARG